MKSKLNFLYKWCNAFSSYFSPNFVLLKLLSLSSIMAIPQFCLTIENFSRWLHFSSLKTDWVFQSLVFYHQLGLVHKFLPQSDILLQFKPCTPIINCLPLPLCSPINPLLCSLLVIKRLISPYTSRLLTWNGLCTLG
jgi:hypothetical protein